MNFDDYETLPTSNVGTHMVAGAIAGVMEHCVMYPLDSVKTRLQSLGIQQPDVDGSIRKTLSSMVRHEGVLRPVRGMSAMVLGAGPSHALYFSSYEYMKNLLVKQTTSTRYHTLIYGASGCISTLLHDGIMNPAEVVKQRLQMLHSPYKSAAQCFLEIYRREGVPAFYRSYTTQLTMNVPFQSLHFMVYEFAQQLTNPERHYNPGAHMISGALAGGIAAALTTPLDVCKTLLNTQQGGATAHGLVDALRKVYELRGVAGYFRGLRARVMYQMPATMLCWSTYEFFKYFLSETIDPITNSTNNNSSTANESVASSASSTPPSSASPTLSHHPNAPTPLAKNSGSSRDVPPTLSTNGLYGQFSFNTMHTANERRRKETILDMIQT